MRMLRATAKAEFLKTTRVPMFVVGTVAFPILFFMLFGLPSANQPAGPVTVGAFLMVSYGAYALMNTAMMSFGISIANERALGWNRVLRVTPMSSAAYIGGKVINSLLIGAFSLTCLFTFAIVTAKVSLAPGVWVQTALLLLLGMMPFILLGLAIGYSVSAGAAPAIANLIAVPLAFGSGLFVPMRMLPKAVQSVAPYLPSYHFGQLGWTTLGAGDGKPITNHLLWILGYSAVFAVLASLAYRRDEGRHFG